MIMHVGDATIVKYAKADAIDVDMPKIMGSPPISSTMGPKIATVAALLKRLVIMPLTITEKNHLKLDGSSMLLLSEFNIESANHLAAPVSFICIPSDMTDPNNITIPQFVLLVKSCQSISLNER